MAVVMAGDEQMFLVGRNSMSDEKTPRQMFPESRFLLGLFSLVLASFFGGCIYFVNLWQPSTQNDKIAKFAVEDVLVTFLMLCGVGFVASLVGPHRIQPLIGRVGLKAIMAGLFLIFGTVAYILYYCLVR